MPINLMRVARREDQGSPGNSLEFVLYLECFRLCDRLFLLC